MRDTRTKVALGVALAATLSVLGSSPAQAVREERRCYDLPPDTRCYTGSTYRHFLNIRTTNLSISGYSSSGEICAKAVNVNNLVRPGSKCANAQSVRACLDNATYVSRAYGSHPNWMFYFNAVASFSHPDANLEVAAATPEDTVGVCGR